ASDAEEAPQPAYGIQPGDRLILAVWCALGVVLGRALLQTFVDLTSEGESGEPLLTHFIEHFLAAASRAWIFVPAVAILPRGGAWPVVALRAAVVAALAMVLLTGWPSSEPRYSPGHDSARGFLGWAALGVAAGVVTLFDRYVTSPRRGIWRIAPPTRYLVTA